MSTFRTVKMSKGDGIRVMRDGRQVAILKPRQAKGDELAAVCQAIERVDLPMLDRLRAHHEEMISTWGEDSGEAGAAFVALQIAEKGDYT